MAIYRALTYLVLAWFTLASAYADDALLDDFSLVYGDEDFVTIATGKRQNRSRAPAIATVISAQDIKASGATDLDQVLELVPGLHVSHSPQLYSPIYTIRGVYSKLNPQVLMLINGIPLTNLYSGDRNRVWAGMPVNNIARIEVIRGPGSAVYGADAFAGVINVITKTKNDILNTETGGRVGSFDDREAWILHGNRWGTFDVALSLQVNSTDGHEQQIEADAQTFFDNLMNTDVSLAPGAANTGRDSIDTRVDISRDYWKLRLGYQGRYDVETGAGIAEALDPHGRYRSDRYNADLTYSNPNFSQDWDVTAQLSYLQTSQDNVEDLVIFPPGTGIGNFPDGVIGNPELYERHWRFNSSAFYGGFEKHQLRFGAGIYYGDLYKVKETKNFTRNESTGALIPLGEVMDLSDTEPFMHENDRTNIHLFFQDQWSFSPDWELTYGLRYDNYSDFGDTLNPRAALVWQNHYNLTSKLLYGKAFRAPSFSEQFNINNPVSLGNPDLKPETIDTMELAFIYKASSTLETSLNLFYYEWDDIIELVPDPAPATSSTAQNSGKQKGYGLEWEVQWNLAENLSLTGNYAYQRATDERSEESAGNAPHHQLYLRGDWSVKHGWQLNTQINIITSRDRPPEDNRDDIEDYAIVDMILRHNTQQKPWEFALVVKNIFDEDAREPSPSPGLFIPNDLPLPGRNFFAEARFSF